ncbi:MAG: autotransporter assembly complex protein TamA [Bdellovibrio bacteriovorus]
MAWLIWWRGWLRGGLTALGLALGSVAQAAETLPYSVVIAPTGDAAVDQIIADASLLVALREGVPVGPFALVARAESDAARIETILRSLGHYDGLIRIRVAGLALKDPSLLGLLEDLPAGSRVSVRVEVDPGPLYRIGAARLEGPAPPGPRAAFDLRPGDPARAERVLAAGEAVLQALREDGYALARVPPPDALVNHATRTMDVTFVAEPGPQVTLGPVSVIGLDRLREDYVRRRLGFQYGEPFSPSRLESARRDLLAHGVLAWARLTPGTEPDPQGRLPLTLELAERPPRVVRLAAAYASDEGATLSATWTHRNLFGRAEQLSLQGELGRATQNRPDALNYLARGTLRIPDLWVRDRDLRLDLAAVSESLDAYDRDAVTTALTLERRFSPRLRGGAGLAFEDARVTQDAVTQDYRLLSLPLTLAYDSTDDPLDPRQGLRLSAAVTPAQILEGEPAPEFTVVRAVGTGYWSLPGLPRGAAGGPERATPPAGPAAALDRRPPPVLAGRLVLGSIVGATANQVPPDWRFYAGGGGSVRGYPFQSIGPRTALDEPAGGDGLLEASLELRQPLRARWALVLFADAGAVSEDGIPGTGDLAVGVGLGVRYQTPVGAVRVDVATPLNPASGDSPVQLYIGIGQAF